MRQHSVVGLVLMLFSALPPGAGAEGSQKPSMSLRVSPAIAFTPAKVVVTAELKNVSPDAAELFCPVIEWTWGDGAQSVESSDCGPFEPGVSQIKTRYVKQYTYHNAGRYRLTLRLKRGNSVVLSASTSVTAREGGYTGPPEE